MSKENSGRISEERPQQGLSRLSLLWRRGWQRESGIHGLLGYAYSGKARGAARRCYFSIPVARSRCTPIENLVELS